MQPPAAKRVKTDQEAGTTEANSVTQEEATPADEVAGSPHGVLLPQDDNKEILDMLECPVCLDFPRPGVALYNCDNGHVICGFLFFPDRH